ncbi:MAG: toll/interleukin-1 receptor domain-containing protein [Desulfuromonadaceae bacterium]|nr:toll/interleukin-1 receptor domain-containing protein [Desulfuromonadaceae bacterium]
MIKLTHGSIFDKKCDLLIIPCNSAGGMTKWVFSNLKENGIPLPDRYIPFGKVLFVGTGLHFEHAEVIAFAASVETETNLSSKKAIGSIGKEIASYCKQQVLRQVNIPLLGSGSGRLSEHESFEALVKSLNSTEDKEVIYEIFTPSLSVYDNLRAAYPDFVEKKEDKKPTNPRVFVSYAGDDQVNAKWVKELAINLRQNGVDARLDKFHLKPGTDLPQWMTNELIMADKVILVCDYSYMIKADVRKGGVGWETMIIQGDMLTQGETRNKYIAIVRENEIDKGLPIYMKSKLAFHWKKQDKMIDDDFKELLFAIFDCDIAPDIGAIPEFITKKMSNKTLS